MFCCLIPISVLCYITGDWTVSMLAKPKAPDSHYAKSTVQTAKSHLKSRGLATNAKCAGTVESGQADKPCLCPVKPVLLLLFIAFI